jgi:hypothetical protein
LVPWIHSKNLKLLNIIKDIDKNRFIEYKQVFEPFYIDKINSIIKKFEQNFINVWIANLYYYEIEREFHIELDNWGLLIFSVDDDISSDLQIEKLAIFNKDYFEINNWIFVYIDLRISNKIFFCSTEIKNQCETNLKGIYNY